MGERHAASPRKSRVEMGRVVSCLGPSDERTPRERIKEMAGITMDAGTLGPFIVRAFLLALPLILAACRQNGSGGSGY